MDRVRTTYIDESGAALVQPVVTGAVVAPAAAVTAVGQTRAVYNRSVVSPASIAGGIFGAAMITFGAVAAARAGFDGPIGEPVVGVFATTATALSGAVIAALGVFMLVAALGRSREAVMFFGIVTAIAGIVTAIEPSVGGGTLGLTSSFAALLAVISLIVAAIAAFVPTIHSTSERVQRTH